MATPRVSETPEVQQHYLAQFALVAALGQALRPLWPRLEPEDLLGTVPAVRRGLDALVERFSLAAISTAADYYEDVRALHVPGSFAAPIIDPPLDDMEARLDAIARELSADLDSLVDEVYLAEITATLEREMALAAQTTVADAASDELFDALVRDTEAKGWARVTRPGACYFCRMLATRGPVYASRETANFRAHTAKNGRGGVCRCTVEPLFGNYYEAPAHTRADIALWERIAANHSGPEAVYEFRRAVEGRTDGPRRPRRRRSDPPTITAPKVKGQRLGFDALTPAQLRHHLAIVESLPDSDYRTSQLSRLRSRLTALGA